MNRRPGLVLTTIAEPAVLEEYYPNFKANDHLDQVKVHVIPDRKTPPGAYDRCAEFRKRGLQVVIPDFNEQECYLRKVGFPPELIPYNSDNRRNIDSLMEIRPDGEAYARGGGAHAEEAKAISRQALLHRLVWNTGCHRPLEKLHGGAGSRPQVAVKLT